MYMAHGPHGHGLCPDRRHRWVVYVISREPEPGADPKHVPIDTGRLALVDPMNVDDVARHEEDRPGSMTYEVVTNDYGVGVAVVLGTGHERTHDHCQ
jgi:hypothetical protein